MSDLPRPHRELTAVPEPKDIPPVLTLRSHHVRWHWDAPYCPLGDHVLPKDPMEGVERRGRDEKLGNERASEE